MGRLKIKEILEEINPNIVYGESTAFHELLTILNCKRKDILYLNPSSCRYPKGRFSLDICIIASLIAPEPNEISFSIFLMKALLFEKI